jgi:hypothetical protein
MELLGWLSLAFVVGLTLVSGAINWRRKEADQHWNLLWKLLAVSTPFVLITNSVVDSLKYLMPTKENLYFFYADRLLGQPSFRVGQFLQGHPSLGNACLMAYVLLPIPVFVLAALYAFAQSPIVTRVYVRTLMLNVGLCIPLYLAFPVAGPCYAFAGFPWIMPEVVSPHSVIFTAIPNGFPSVHTSTALLFLHFASRWKVGAVVAFINLVLVLLATLGTGEHYGIDLFAGAIYAACVIWIGSEENVSVHERAILVYA